MKKILIVNNNMHIGGVQKSLVNLLRNISGEYQVTLLLFSRRGSLMADIPETVRVITPKSPYIFFGLTRDDPMTVFQKLGRGFFAAIARILGRSWTVALMSLFQKRIRGYDVAVSFLHSGAEKSFYGGCNEFVLRHVEAKKKVTFLHCDFGKINANTARNRKIYDTFDQIAACSEGCRQAFIQQIPHLEERVKVVENFCDFEAVRTGAAKEPVSLGEGRVNILSVARLGQEKGIDRGVQAISMLGQLRDTVHYHIVGSGAQYSRIRQLIDREGLEDTVTMHGSQANPYGYIEAADLLLIPSVSEAAPMIIHEAAVLGTPILSTQTSSALEMIDETGFGWVCENSLEGITQSLVKLLEQPELLREKSAYLRQYRHSNAGAMGQIRGLFD